MRLRVPQTDSGMRTWSCHGIRTSVDHIACVRVRNSLRQLKVGENVEGRFGYACGGQVRRHAPTCACLCDPILLNMQWQEWYHGTVVDAVPVPVAPKSDQLGCAYTIQYEDGDLEEGIRRAFPMLLVFPACS